MFPKLPGEDPQSGQYDFLVSLKTAARDHGQIFIYKCADTIALMWACERVTGCRYADLLSHYVWSKLGAEQNASIVCDVKEPRRPWRHVHHAPRSGTVGSDAPGGRHVSRPANPARVIHSRRPQTSGSGTRSLRTLGCWPIPDAGWCVP